MHTDLQETVEFLKKTLPACPHIGLILGSGLGEYAESFPSPLVIPYDEIPHFPASTVTGHRGRLLFQQFEHSAVLAMQGRFHYYEGYTIEQVTFPIRIMGLLGIQRLILTNAAGGVNQFFEAGDLMLLRDHINYMGVNPLIGPHFEELGNRFPDMTHVYSPENCEIFVRVARERRIPLQQGVYMAFSGPSYETPAEIRMARILGADAVGMSTVPEAIVATQMGIKVAGVSCITNLAAGMSAATLDHRDVMDTADRAKKNFIALIDGAVAEFGTLLS
ncbi:purine-nucleoside phosphorylase [candidate division KSB3 bacterium]|uniref:Purine nucleoside phosphorylase n=1 Tax=candidate division KSB3 bacterium TaxID=2044937 RepID=A0A2G6E832_9BACT|nr:MAG: purine-nucleoside phosphorylase [candidate division KSB3 bacterium]PIE30509.1 MAG: purine-nucleoside phosphorylase [candidate division KSB3 bacterium]